MCASRAITLRGEGREKRIAVDYRACIRCYCCHEICPAKAITIKRSLF
ncbi:MAG: 4Fe-4S binding protein [Spirochaetaceae bacterium]|nr:4Fe-4S binding protein [Spirochaetaceae bacterium]